MLNQFENLPEPDDWYQFWNQLENPSEPENENHFENPPEPENSYQFENQAEPENQYWPENWHHSPNQPNHENMENMDPNLPSNPHPELGPLFLKGNYEFWFSHFNSHAPRMVLQVNKRIINMTNLRISGPFPVFKNITKRCGI